MLLSPIATLLLGASLSCLTHATSTISTFADANCKDSLVSVDGPNGYPNGTCTDLRGTGTYGSFQVVGLDPGCTVTIYAADTTADVCSGYAVEVEGIADCYNSTWVYYSIDFCDASAAQSTALPTSESTSPAQSSSSSDAKSPSHTGAIVGGVVGGVLALAAIVGATIYLTRRHLAKQKTNVHESGMTEVSELPAEHAKEMPVATEVYEKMAHEPEPPPVELPGHELERPEERAKPSPRDID